MTAADFAAIASIHISTARRWLASVPYHTVLTGGRPLRVYDPKKVREMLLSPGEGRQKIAEKLRCAASAHL